MIVIRYFTSKTIRNQYRSLFIYSINRYQEYAALLDEVILDKKVVLMLMKVVESISFKS